MSGIDRCRYEGFSILRANRHAKVILKNRRYELEDPNMDTKRFDTIEQVYAYIRAWKPRKDCLQRLAKKVGLP